MGKTRRQHKQNNDSLINMDILKLTDILGKIGNLDIQTLLGGLNLKDTYNSDKKQNENQIDKLDSSITKKQIAEAVAIIMNADRAELFQVVMSIYGNKNDKTISDTSSSGGSSNE